MVLIRSRDHYLSDYPRLPNLPSNAFVITVHVSCHSVPFSVFLSGW
jgi:hypothetical protein